MSLLRETLESGKFAVTTEMAPPKGTDLSHLLECAKPLVGRVHAANVTDFQSAVMRTTSLATCKLLKDVGLEPVLQPPLRLMYSMLNTLLILTLSP